MIGGPDQDRPDRHAGILDRTLVTAAPLMQIGVGRGGDFAKLMAAAGTRQLTVIDPGTIEADNVGQSGYGLSEVGLTKPDAVEVIVHNIAPAAVVTKHRCRAEEVESLDTAMRRQALVKIGVDDMQAMFRLADQAQAAGTDTIVCGTQGDNQQFFVAGVLPGGPALQDLLPAVWRSLQDGYVPPVFFPSSLINATMLNTVAARIAVGLLHHRAGSALAISAIGRAFIAQPLVIGLNGYHEPSGSLMPMRLIGRRA